MIVAVADLTRCAGGADAVDGVVEPLEHRGDPGAADLGHDELQSGEALEHPGEDLHGVRFLALGDVARGARALEPASAGW